MTAARQPTALAVFRHFLGLGCRAFGGPFVQIETLHHELVERAGWVEPERFRRALAVYQALPGPEATEMCIWLGTTVRGRLGGLLAGLGFVLPGLSLMLLAAFALQSRALPEWCTVGIAGMQGGALALLLRAAWRLVLVNTRKRRLPLAIAAATLLGAVLGAPFAASLIAGGLLLQLVTGLDRSEPRTRAKGRAREIPVWLVGLAWATVVGFAALGTDQPFTSTVATPSAPPPHLATLANVGLGAGLLTFGGAYTAIPFLEHAATGAHGWMTNADVLSGIAVGSVLPAPMIVVGTWVGWAGGGLFGALVLSLGIFLPAFLFPLLLHGPLERLTMRPSVHAFLDGVAASVSGLVVATALQMGAAHTTRFGALGLCVVAAVAFVLARWRSPWSVPVTMLACAGTGWLLPKA